MHHIRTIGMFEQNNVGVRRDSPIAALVARLAPGDAACAPLLEAAELIEQSLNGL